MLKVGRKGGPGLSNCLPRSPIFCVKTQGCALLAVTFHSVALAADTPPSHYLGNQFPTLDFLFLIPGVIFVFPLGP